MRASGYSQISFVICAMLALNACEGERTSPPQTQNAMGSHSTPDGAEVRVAPAAHTLALRARAPSGALLYIAGTSKDYVGTLYIYYYPSAKLKAKLTGFPMQLPNNDCADANGHVYISDSDYQYDESNILEYSSGNFVKTLADKYGPQACAVDPTTGNIATVSHYLTIYERGKGPPSIYSYPSDIEPYYCGYDDKGNLFVDGIDDTLTYIRLSELVKGAKSMINIKLPTLTIPSSTPKGPGNVQWDGKFLALGDGGGTIYRFSILGTKALKKGETLLDGSRNVGSFWIYGSTIVGDNQSTTSVAIWPYPKGGEPSKTIKNIGYFFGVTVTTE
jgi:hypothetical protein